jgi:hypothetical protein
MHALLEDENPSAQLIADSLLDYAINLDQGRPVDDITIASLRVSSHAGDLIRRLSVRLPI